MCFWQVAGLTITRGKYVFVSVRSRPVCTRLVLRHGTDVCAWDPAGIALFVCFLSTLSRLSLACDWNVLLIAFPIAVHFCRSLLCIISRKSYTSTLAAWSPLKRSFKMHKLPWALNCSRLFLYPTVMGMLSCKGSMFNCVVCLLIRPSRTFLQPMKGLFLFSFLFLVK